MKYSPGDSVLIHGKLPGYILCICQYQNDYTYRVSYFDSGYYELEVYEFELEEFKTMGFK